jgi:hypothetical protein
MAKTVPVCFSRAKIKDQLDIRIDSTQFKLVENVKFLGVISDSHLTWKSHLQYIKERCQKRINLLRSIAGQKWGAKSEILLTLYKTLFRPILDFGDIAFNNISIPQISKCLMLYKTKL